jgi:hypothetical protein
MDEDGWLYFDGRIKDAIRRRGENVSAQEVEMIVNEHTAVLESAAIPVPSELSEEDVMVLVSPRNGAQLDPEALVEFCRERMPRYMVPRYVEIWDGPLPRTPSEKIAKQELKSRGKSERTWDREAAETRVGTRWRPASTSSRPPSEPARCPRRGRRRRSARSAGDRPRASRRGRATRERGCAPPG